MIRSCCNNVYAAFNCVIKREFSASEAATALRPFYFAVHPDLFGRFPTERAVNEQSLKQFNSYMESLCNNIHTPPIQVTFYLRHVRDSIQTSSFKSVNISLVDQDVRVVVQQVLHSCNLSTDDVKKTTTKASVSEKPNEYYVSSQKESLIAFKIKPKPVPTIRDWLVKNVPMALKNSQENQAIHRETALLSQQLCKELGLKAVIWESPWCLTHFRNCLRSFSTLYHQHPQVMENLQGRTLVFANKTGISMNGHVTLSSQDVQNMWLDMLRDVAKYDDILRHLPLIETELSKELCNIQVVRRRNEPTVQVMQYTMYVNRLLNSIKIYKSQFNLFDRLPDSLQGHQLVVEGITGSLSLSPTGQFIVPASCPASLIVEFLSKNRKEAFHRMSEDISQVKECQALADLCVTELGLTSITKDDCVSSPQAIACYQRLLDNSKDLKDILRYGRLNVTSYYSVLRDGQICIPWHWKH